MPAVLYGRDTWSLDINGKTDWGCLRGAFRPKREEVTRGWRKLRNEELRTLYFSLNINEDNQGKDRIRWSEHVAHVGDMVNVGVYRILTGKHEGKRPVGRFRRRWYDNTKMYIKNIRCVWIGIHLAPNVILR